MCENIFYYGFTNDRRGDFWAMCLSEGCVTQVASAVIRQVRGGIL